MAMPTLSSRWSSLSARLAILIAALLALSAIVTTAYSAMTAHSSASASSELAMQKALESTSLLIHQSNDEERAFRSTALSDRAAHLKDVAAPIIEALKTLNAQVEAGHITQAAAQASALNMMRSIRYGNNDYFFTYNSKGVAIAHPDKRFDGKNLWDVRDADGNFVVRNLLHLSETKGSGYLLYKWPRLNATTAAPGLSAMPSGGYSAPKLAYVYNFAPWDWTIGTGVYLDDIDQAVEVKRAKDAEGLRQSFTQLDMANRGLIFVLNKDGKVAIAPANRDLSALDSATWGKAMEATALKNAPKTDGPITHVNTTASLSGEPETWQMDIARIPNSTDPSRDWTLVAAVPDAEIKAPGNSLALKQALLSLLVLILGIGIGLLTSRRIVRPVEQITAAARDLQEERFDPASLDDVAARTDEVGILAQTFQRMGSELVERERKLREQVRKLTVMIDRKKVEEEASAITETDYFKSLAEKASQIRKQNADANL
jgi:HAMP domain-containing protein